MLEKSILRDFDWVWKKSENYHWDLSGANNTISCFTKFSNDSNLMLCNSHCGMIEIYTVFTQKSLMTAQTLAPLSYAFCSTYLPDK